MRIGNAIFVATFVAGFAVTEAVMIDDPDAVRPIRERTLVRTYGRPAEESEDIPSLRQRAEQGDAEAQFHLGWAYRDGKGVRKNDAEAMKWFRRAAEQGHAHAQVALSAMYGRFAGTRHFGAGGAAVGCHRGENVPRNNAEATEWRHRATERAEAMEWHCRAAERAERGDAKAQYALSQNYRHGAGVPRDTMEAMKWLRRAAEQGHAKAQTDIDSILNPSVPNPFPARIRAADGKEGESALMECAGIYVVSRPDDGLVKVGKTGDFRGRFTQIRSDCFSAGHPNVVPVVLFPVNENRGAVEERAHAKLREYRTAGEWFNCDADTAIRAVLDSLP